MLKNKPALLFHSFLTGGLLRTVVDLPGNIVSWFSNKFFGGGRRGAAPTPPLAEDASGEYSGDESVSDNNQPIDMTRCGHSLDFYPVCFCLEKNSKIKGLLRRLAFTDQGPALNVAS